MTIKAQSVSLYFSAFDLRSSTSGHAFWQSQFDHWEHVPGNIEKEIITDIRKRRGLSPEVPRASKFIDEA